MTPQECTDGRPRRRRARDGRGGGRGAGRGGGDGRGRGTSVARGAAASVAAFVAKDVLDPDGLVRPVLRGAAERLQNSPSRLLCRAGARYLELDPHPVEVIEPVSAAVPQGGGRASTAPRCPCTQGESGGVSGRRRRGDGRRRGPGRWTGTPRRPRGGRRRRLDAGGASRSTVGRPLLPSM